MGGGGGNAEKIIFQMKIIINNGFANEAPFTESKD